jgi:hypothetical protein
MSTAIHTALSQPPRVHASSAAADERRVRRLSALIFAELLPWCTSHLARLRPSLSPWPSLGDPGELQSSEVTTYWLTSSYTAHSHISAMQAGKEVLTMRAYRTESSYYFSSKQFLPAGTLVFFSDKYHRYVHPTAGTLLDPHPRLQQLSDAESQELEAQWQEDLARF